jgi:hypothetical protein
VRDGDKSFVWVVKDSRVRKVAITLGERDARSGEFVLEAGLAEGDQVLRYPGALLRDGQAVQAGTPAAPGGGDPAGKR